MFEKLIRPALFTTLILLLSACIDSNEPQLNKQYSLLNNDLSELNLDPITEVFSLTCGHCWNMEKFIPEIEALTNQPVGKVHVTFNQSAQVSAMLYYAAAMQLPDGPSHELVDGLFSAVQRQEGTLSQQQADIEHVFETNQLVSPYRFDSTKNSELEKQIRVATAVTEKAMINSVPSFIIKGKYLLITEGHEGIEDLSNTINYLISKPE